MATPLAFCDSQYFVVIINNNAWYFIAPRFKYLASPSCSSGHSPVVFSAYGLCCFAERNREMTFVYNYDTENVMLAYQV